MTKRSLFYEFSSLRTETLLQTWLRIFISLSFRVFDLLDISCSSKNTLSLELVSSEERQNIACDSKIRQPLLDQPNVASFRVCWLAEILKLFPVVQSNLNRIIFSKQQIYANNVKNEKCL